MPSGNSAFAAAMAAAQNRGSAGSSSSPRPSDGAAPARKGGSVAERAKALGLADIIARGGPGGRPPSKSQPSSPPRPSGAAAPARKGDSVADRAKALGLAGIIARGGPRGRPPPEPAPHGGSVAESSEPPTEATGRIAEMDRPIMRKKRKNARRARKSPIRDDAVAAPIEAVSVATARISTGEASNRPPSSTEPASFPKPEDAKDLKDPKDPKDLKVPKDEDVRQRDVGRASHAPEERTRGAATPPRSREVTAGEEEVVRLLRRNNEAAMYYAWYWLGERGAADARFEGATGSAVRVSYAVHGQRRTATIPESFGAEAGSAAALAEAVVQRARTRLRAFWPTAFWPGSELAVLGLAMLAAVGYVRTADAVPPAVEPAWQLARAIVLGVLPSEDFAARLFEVSMVAHVGEALAALYVCAVDLRMPAGAVVGFTAATFVTGFNCLVPILRLRSARRAAGPQKAA